MDSVSRHKQFRMQIEPSMHCNLNCRFCDRKRASEKGELEDFEILRRLRDSIAAETGRELAEVRIAGGEPTLYPKINSLIDYLHSEFVIPSDGRVCIQLYTNAIELERIDIERLEKVIPYVSVYPNIRRTLIKKGIFQLLKKLKRKHVCMVVEHETFNIIDAEMLRGFDPVKTCLIPTVITNRTEIYPCCRGQRIEKEIDKVFHVKLKDNNLYKSLWALIKNSDLCSHCPRAHRRVEKYSFIDKMISVVEKRRWFS